LALCANSLGDNVGNALSAAVFANEMDSGWQTFTLSTSDEREACQRKTLKA
jgi:hypothetical protein